MSCILLTLFACFHPPGAAPRRYGFLTGNDIFPGSGPFPPLRYVTANAVNITCMQCPPSYTSQSGVYLDSPGDDSALILTTIRLGTSIPVFNPPSALTVARCTENRQVPLPTVTCMHDIMHASSVTNGTSLPSLRTLQWIRDRIHAYHGVTTDIGVRSTNIWCRLVHEIMCMYAQSHAACKSRISRRVQRIMERRARARANRARRAKIKASNLPESTRRTLGIFALIFAPFLLQHRIKFQLSVWMIRLVYHTCRDIIACMKWIHEQFMHAVSLTSMWIEQHVMQETATAPNCPTTFYALPVTICAIFDLVWGIENKTVPFSYILYLVKGMIVPYLNATAVILVIAISLAECCEEVKVRVLSTHSSPPPSLHFAPVDRCTGKVIGLYTTTDTLDFTHTAPFVTHGSHNSVKRDCAIVQVCEDVCSTPVCSTHTVRLQTNLTVNMCDSTVSLLCGIAPTEKHVEWHAPHTVYRPTHLDWGARAEEEDSGEEELPTPPPWFRHAYAHMWASDAGHADMRMPCDDMSDRDGDCVLDHTPTTPWDSNHSSNDCVMPTCGMCHAARTYPHDVQSLILGDGMDTNEYDADTYDTDSVESYVCQEASHISVLRHAWPTAHDHELSSIDMRQAYRQADLTEDTYVDPPPSTSRAVAHDGFGWCPEDFPPIHSRSMDGGLWIENPYTRELGWLRPRECSDDAAHLGSDDAAHLGSGNTSHLGSDNTAHLGNDNTARLGSDNAHATANAHAAANATAFTHAHVKCIAVHCWYAQAHVHAVLDHSNYYVHSLHADWSSACHEPAVLVHTSHCDVAQC